MCVLFYSYISNVTYWRPTNRATTCNEVAIRTLHHWWKGTAELAHVFEGMHAAEERRSSAPASSTSLYRQRLYRLLQLTTDDVSRQIRQKRHIHDGALQWDCWRSCLRNRLKLLLWAELEVRGRPESWEYMDAEIEPSNAIHISMQLACWQREGCWARLLSFASHWRKNISIGN